MAQKVIDLIAFLLAVLMWFGVDAKVLKASSSKWGLTDRPTPREKILAVALAVVAAWSFAGQISSRPQGTIQYVTAWGRLTTSSSYVQVDTASLTNYANADVLACVEFYWDGTVDPEDTGGLQISRGYDITGGPIRIIIPWDAQFAAPKNRQPSPSSVYVLLAVPKAVQLNSFGTIRQAKALGATVLEKFSGP